MAAMDTQIAHQKVSAAASSKEDEFVKCECCGLTEECTEGYKTRVEERFHGRWICGLCSEAVKDEVLRSQICNEEAMNRHMSFCKKFRSRSSPPPNPTKELISAMKHLIFKSLDSPSSRLMRKNSMI